MGERKRISYKAKYLEAEKMLNEKNEEIEKLKKEIVSIKNEKQQLEKQAEQSDKEAEEYLDHLKRLKAEFENYKKRMIRERQQIVNWAVEDLIRDFLPVLDDLERAIKCSETSKDFDGLFEGIKMVHQHFKKLLKEKGLEEIPAEGKEFDPHIHEALMQVESDKHPDNVVVEELRKGYRFKDKVLRPALVKVNKRVSNQKLQEDEKDKENTKQEEEKRK